MDNLNERIEILKYMNDFIIELGDEDIYSSWIMIVPDEPTESEFIDIAMDIPFYNYVSKVYYELIAYDEKHNY